MRYRLIACAGLAPLALAYAVAGPFVFGCNARVPFIVVVAVAAVSAGALAAEVARTGGRVFAAAAGFIAALLFAATVTAAGFVAGLSHCGG